MEQKTAKSKDLIILEKLVSTYNQGLMSALVGAGFSLNVHSKKYLLWNELLKDVYKDVYADEIEAYCEARLDKYISCQEDKAPTTEIEKKREEFENEYVNSHIKKEDLLQLVSKYVKMKGCHEAIDVYIENRTPYAKMVDDKIVLSYSGARDDVRDIVDADFSAHKALLNCEGFKNIYTTNYDNLIEFTADNLLDGCEYNKRPITKASQLSTSIGQKNIIKIHGDLRMDIDNPDCKKQNDFVFDGDHNIRYIIAQEDYDSYFKKHEAFSYLMRIAMLSGTFCLIGFSGSDPNYKTWVNWMKDILCKEPEDGEDERTKVFLISTEPVPNVKEELSDKELDNRRTTDLFNKTHRMEVLHLFDEQVLDAIFNKQREKKGGSLSRKQVLCAFLEYIYERSPHSDKKTSSLYDLGLKCYKEKDYEKAFDYFEKSSKKRSLKAKAMLAECYCFGRGVKVDFDKAIELCNEKGVTVNPSVLMGIAWHFEWNDEEEALKWYRKAAEQGHVSAQYDLGFNYAQGIGVEKDEKAAVEWFRKAAEQGHALAQCNLGVCYAQGIGVDKDEKAAVEWYRKAAEQGYEDAQCNLGVCYEQGIGVDKDEKAAAIWYLKAAEQGHAQAQCYLGVRYEQGIGVDKDEKAAAVWFRKAADQGYASAQCNLGVCYEQGIGVDKDEKAAVEWYRKAANQGYANAQCNLGLIYEEGIGVDKDEKAAVEWYRKAANQGYARAQNNLAWYLQEHGQYEEALQWIEKVIEQDPNDALYIDTLATVYQGLKRYEEALVQFERCLSVYYEQNEADSMKEVQDKIDALRQLKDEKKA